MIVCWVLHFSLPFFDNSSIILCRDKEMAKVLYASTPTAPL